MYKKTRSVLTCLALLVSLFAAPALAGLGGGPAGSPSFTATDHREPWLGAWLADLFAWLGPALDEVDEDGAGTTWQASKNEEDSEEPDSDISVSPMGGPSLDPDG